MKYQTTLKEICKLLPELSYLDLDTLNYQICSLMYDLKEKKKKEVKQCIDELNKGEEYENIS